MVYDAHKNFGFTVVGVAPATPTGGTTFSVLNANAVNLPDPASVGAYNLTVAAANQQPLSTNSEIIRVTAKGAADSGGAGFTQFTISRLAENNAGGSMTARSIQVGDWISHSITAKTLTDVETNKLDRDGSQAVTGALLFTNDPSLSSPVFGSHLTNDATGSTPYAKNVTNGQTLDLIFLNFRNTHTTNQEGAFNGIKIITQADAVDTSAGIDITNNGGADALHIGVKGNSALGAQNLPTGIGLDFNKGAGATEGGNNNAGYGIQVWDWSQTDQGGNTPTMLYLNKRLNVDTHHVLALLNANRNAMRFTVPEAGAYTGAEPLLDVQGGGSFAQRMVITANGNIGVGPNIPSLEIESFSRNGVRVSGGNNVAVYFDVPASGVGRIVSQDGSLANNGRILAFTTTTNLAEVARFDTNGNFGIGTNNPTAKLEVQGSIISKGGLYVDTLAAPPTPTITPQGTAGSTAYGYKITFVTATGETVGSTEGTTATGNATLTSGNNNKVAWTMPSGKLISKVNIYRTTGGATQGLIGSTTGNTLSFNDTGIAATTVIPTVNTTGNVGFGVASPTATLHLKAGTASASTAPLKFSSGTNLSATEAGTMEFDGTSFYLTPSSTRKTIGYTDMSNLVPVASFSMNSQKLTNVLDPIAAQDAATKNYVDSIAQGLSPKPSAVVATTAGLPTYTYNNGSSGVGATITGLVTGVLTIDGYTVALNDYILVKNETSTNAPNNGLYKCTLAGAVGVAFVLTRAVEMNQPTEFDGGFIFIEQGTVNVSSGWVCTTTGTVTIGTTNIGFTQFSGAGEIIAGTGLSKSGNTLSIDAAYVGQTSITTLGTITSGTWTGTTIAVANGGTGQASYTNGQLLIGNTTGNTLTKTTLTAGNSIAITNGTGSITIDTIQDIRTSASPVFSGLSISALTVTGQSIISAIAGAALAVGPNGTTNPTLQIDTSITSTVTGILIKGNIAASGLALSVQSSGTDENLTIDAKGAGTLTLNGTATGGIITSRNIAITIPSAGNVQALTLTQNDSTNNPNVINIVNAGTGAAINIQTKNTAVGTTGVAALYMNTTDTMAIDKGAKVSLGGYSTGTTVFSSFGGIAGRKENSTDANTRGYLQLVVNDSEKWRISSDGDLGYGGAGPTSGRYNYNISFVNATTATKSIGMERNTTSNTAGNAFTLQAGGATLSATDKNGGNFIIKPGLSTGMGRAQVQIQGLTTALSTGSTDNTLLDRAIVGAFKALTNNSAINLVNCTLASNTLCGGIIKYTIEVFDSTNLQMEVGEIMFACVNKGGVFSLNTMTQIGSAKQTLGSGTLTVTWAISAANPAVISLNANSSLTPATGYPRVTYTIENYTQQAVAIQ